MYNVYVHRVKMELIYDVLRLLRKELHLAMTFAGCSNVADITPDYVRHASYYTHQK